MSKDHVAAKAMGALFGVAGLLGSLYAILHYWHGLSQSLRVYVLFVPSIFISIAVLALLYAGRILGARLYRRFRGIGSHNEFAFMDGKSWSWLVFPIWIAVGLGLYGALNLCCG